MPCWIATAWSSGTGRIRRRTQGTPLSLGQRPNDLWCTEYTGEFQPGNHHSWYPLTVTDRARRFLLPCDALSSTKEPYASTAFERRFKERGLPANIRSDNGVLFSSAHALLDLSRLAVWWVRLGIGIERIQPGRPHQNGGHERMHLTLKKEATKPAGANFMEQIRETRRGCRTRARPRASPTAPRSHPPSIRRTGGQPHCVCPRGARSIRATVIGIAPYL